MKTCPALLSDIQRDIRKKKPKTTIIAKLKRLARRSSTWYAVAALLMLGASLATVRAYQRTPSAALVHDLRSVHIDASEIPVVPPPPPPAPKTPTPKPKTPTPTPKPSTNYAALRREKNALVEQVLDGSITAVRAMHEFERIAESRYVAPHSLKSAVATDLATTLGGDGSWLSRRRILAEYAKHGLK